MKNLTVSLPDDVYRNARVVAARRDTSVSALVVAYLQGLSDRMDTIVMSALTARQRFQVSYWDAAIIEAARVVGCTEIMSEDLGDGQDYAGIRVANPFR